jgi:hypothetical protein
MSDGRYDDYEQEQEHEQDRDREPERDDVPPPRRMYLHEPGWRIKLKVGNDREFCYMTAPGQDYYHRVYDGELYVQRGDERLCMACAQRRGLLSFEPKQLRQTISVFEILVQDSAAEIELLTRPEDDRSS